MKTNRLWEIGAKPVVIAHRGGGSAALENSQNAFLKMREAGFRFAETDAHATADGKVVLFHDSVLDRVTQARGKISQWKWNDLKHVETKGGGRILPFDETLEEFPDLIFNVDAKHWGVVRPLIEVIKRHRAQGQVSLSSFSESRLKVLRAKLPGIRSSLGTGAIAQLVISSWLPTTLRRPILASLPGPERGAEAVQVPVAFKNVQVLTRPFIELAKQRGLAVHAWTINAREDMERLIRLGVDGIITDNPELAREVIDEVWKP